MFGVPFFVDQTHPSALSCFLLSFRRTGFANEGILSSREGWTYVLLAVHLDIFAAAMSAFVLLRTS